MENGKPKRFIQHRKSTTNNINHRFPCSNLQVVEPENQVDFEPNTYRGKARQRQQDQKTKQDRSNDISLIVYSARATPAPASPASLKKPALVDMSKVKGAKGTGGSNGGKGRRGVKPAIPSVTNGTGGTIVKARKPKEINALELVPIQARGFVSKAVIDGDKIMCHLHTGKTVHIPLPKKK